MTIHKEGYRSIAISAMLFVFINIISFYVCKQCPWLSWILLAVSGIFFFLIVSFFRIPARHYTYNANAVIAPADGKVVVIEEILPDEFFTDKRIQVSIFMSPLNVHVNRNPIAGKVVYSKYHKGKYLVAWHPKSSTDNERHTVVIENNGTQILVKQIAGAVAKRIINYLQVGNTVKQNEELGFIKFGSRVDLILPLTAKIKVKIGDKPIGGVTEIAQL